MAENIEVVAGSIAVDTTHLVTLYRPMVYTFPQGQVGTGGVLETAGVLRMHERCYEDNAHVSIELGGAVEGSGRFSLQSKLDSKQR